MNIAFCNFDFENWRFDLAYKLAKEFNDRGHTCYYYSYKRQVASVFAKVPTRMHLVQFGKYHKSIPLVEHQRYSPEELDNIARYNETLNAMLHRPRKADNELRHKVCIFLEKLRQYHESCKPDLYIIWGGNRFHEKAIATFAQKNGARSFLFELGYFRPFTLTVDEKGLNAENSVPRDPAFFRALYPNAKVDFAALMKPTSAVFTPNHELSKLLGNPSERVLGRDRLARHFAKQKHVDLNKKYVFVPFQVESDTQIVEHSPYIKSMRNLVAITAEAVTDYNLRYNEDLHVIYKPHPVDVDVNLSYIENFLPVYPHAEIAYKESTQDLIAHAELVMTINSTVGIEALLQRKRVITLGNAFYAIPGLATPVTDYDQLPDIMKRVMDSKVDEAFVYRYLKYLREEYFHEIYYEGADPASISSLADRLLARATDVRRRTA